MSNHLKIVKQYLAAYGMRAGLPYGMVRTAMDTIDVAAHPLDTFRRWQAASHSKDSAWARQVPRDTAFCRIGPGEIPGLDDFVGAGREIYQRQVQGELKDRRRNPFHTLCTQEILQEYPILLETAMSRPLVDAATGYFGTVPRLFYLDLWVTRPNLEEELYSSQLYHLDKPDAGILTLFLNVFDTEAKQGPFTFLPADISRRIRRATQYDRISILGNGRLTDEMVFQHCGRDAEISLAGPAGAGGFVDTSVCLHAGSRCEDGERVMLVVRYMPAYRDAKSYDAWFKQAHVNGDPIRRMVVPSALN